MSVKFYELSEADRKRVNAFIKELVAEQEVQSQIRGDLWVAMAKTFKESE